jgi:hypothetical protein
VALVAGHVLRARSHGAVSGSADDAEHRNRQPTAARAMVDCVAARLSMADANGGRELLTRFASSMARRLLHQRNSDSVVALIVIRGCAAPRQPMIASSLDKRAAPPLRLRAVYADY